MPAKISSFSKLYGIIVVELRKNDGMKSTLTLSAFLMLFFASCSYYLSPYTSKIQRETNLSEEQLKKIQFYLEGDIVIYRALGTSETQITGGEIKIVNGEKVEEVVIASGTPGVIIGTQESGKLLVSFESDGSYLLFGPNGDYGGKYTMMAKEWEGRAGIVDYAGKEYKSTPESIYAYLTVNMEEVNNSTVESKQASGRTIDQ